MTEMERGERGEGALEKGEGTLEKGYGMSGHAASNHSDMKSNRERRDGEMRDEK